MMQQNWAIPSRHSPELFKELSPSDCRSILSASDEGVFSSGQQIFGEGEPQKNIFLLMQGLVRVSKVNEQGDEAILWINVPGEVIGSMTFSLHSHSSSALAVQACKVAMWRRPKFEAILERFPLLQRNAQHILLRQTDELSSRIIEMSTTPVEFRLARTLIRMIDHVGRRVEGKLEVDLPQEALASMTGTTPYNANHVLSGWERQGLIVRGRCRIVIRDLSGLRNLQSADFTLVSSRTETSELSPDGNKALGY